LAESSLDPSLKYAWTCLRDATKLGNRRRTYLEHPAHPAHGLYAKPLSSCLELLPQIEIPTELGYLPRPMPPLESLSNLSKDRNAVSINVKLLSNSTPPFRRQPQHPARHEKFRARVNAWVFSNVA